MTERYFLCLICRYHAYPIENVQAHLFSEHKIKSKTILAALYYFIECEPNTGRIIAPYVCPTCGCRRRYYYRARAKRN